VIAAAPPRFRAMAPADLDRVMVINCASFRHPWSADLMRREMLHDWSTVLLAVAEGSGSEEVQGFIVYWTVHDEIHVLNVAVAPEHRRRGIARALMLEAEARGRRRGIRLVTLEVRRSNDAAIALYRQLGYRVVGVRPNYYAEEGEDAIVMERALP
jgi:[ribosomal protein S18]-alanine N-acetyltransferase